MESDLLWWTPRAKPIKTYGGQEKDKSFRELRKELRPQLRKWTKKQLTNKLFFSDLVHRPTAAAENCNKIALETSHKKSDNTIQ